MSVVRGFFCVLCVGLWTACGGSTEGSNPSHDGGGGTAGAAGTTGSGGVPGNCGGLKCDFGQRCAHRTCDAPDSEGYCKNVPLDCIQPPDTWEPVCDCQGIVRRYSCGEFDTAPPERCTEFPCGGSKCTIATQYCERQASDVAGVPDAYACKPLPASCSGAVSCACVRSELCGTSCRGSGLLGMVLTCPGG